MTTRCHSVRSRRSPVALSRQVSEVATLKLATGRPSFVRRISGSFPRLPTRITLLTLPAMTLSCSLPHPSGTLIPSPRPRRRFRPRHHAFPQQGGISDASSRRSLFVLAATAHPCNPFSPAFFAVIAADVFGLRCCFVAREI